MTNQNSGLDGMEAFMSQFADEGSDQVRAALDVLELNMAMLSPDDQEFIVGTKAVYDTGGGITPIARKRVGEMVAKLGNTSHELMTDVAALTMGQVIKDLASVQKQLTPEELHFAIAISKKLKARQRLTQQEITLICQMHTRKGF